MPADDSDTAASAWGLVEAYWPYDGPYDHARTVAAAEVIGWLVRYLTNATAQAHALPEPCTAGEVITSIGATVYGLDQLLAQLADFFTMHAHDNPNLYDDRRDPNHPAADTAHNLAAALESARHIAAVLAGQLDHATSHATHLGVQVIPTN